MASPLFDPKHRPVAPAQLGSSDIGRLHAKANPLVVSVDSAPGIFLHAHKCVEQSLPCRLPRIPEEWKKSPPKVFLIPLTASHTLKNGNETVVIQKFKETTQAVKEAFHVLGCEIEEGVPNRFDRREPI